jgi:hypothetical protein
MLTRNTSALRLEEYLLVIGEVAVKKESMLEKSPDAGIIHSIMIELTRRFTAPVTDGGCVGGPHCGTAPQYTRNGNGHRTYSNTYYQSTV